MNPSVFFDLLFFEASSGESRSLNHLSIEADCVHSVQVTKQGLDRRFTKEAVSFIQSLIQRLFTVKLGGSLDRGWLVPFNRVLIKDGTRFELPEAHQARLPGSGGNASKAGACLQLELDIKEGRMLDLTLTPGSRPDIKEVTDRNDELEPNDLVIRDLGYYTFQSFQNIMLQKAFFLSRLHPKTLVFERPDQLCPVLDFGALHHDLQQQGVTRLEKDVFLGREDRIPVRLIIELVPETVYEQRMRKTGKIHQKRKCKTSQEYRDKARFNLYITNAPVDWLPPEMVLQLYRLRWQIELIFKIWKSVIGIHNNRKMKYERWLCQLYMKLLIMLIFWNITMIQRNNQYHQQGRLISPMKCFQTLFDQASRLRIAIRSGGCSIRQFVSWAHRVLSNHHLLERKKNKLGFKEIITLNYC